MWHNFWLVEKKNVYEKNPKQDSSNIVLDSNSLTQNTYKCQISMNTYSYFTSYGRIKFQNSTAYISETTRNIAVLKVASCSRAKSSW